VSASPALLVTPQSAELRISILHVPDCPSLGEVRQTLQMALRSVDATAVIEEVEGEYSSPTLLIDGIGVDGCTPGCLPACRINLPTHEEIATAIRAALARRSDEARGNRAST
jgi:hypothetical protein